MYKFYYKLSVLLLAILFINSCTKDNYIQTDVLSELNEELSVRAPSGFDEGTCIVDGKAGIVCFASCGNTCTEAHDCKPIADSPINAHHYFTQHEIDNWLNIDYKQNRPFMLHMWEIGYFNHPDSIR